MAAVVPTVVTPAVFPVPPSLAKPPLGKPAAGKLPFEQQIPIIEEQIKRRRHRWRLSFPTFEDVIQEITIHACKQYSSPKSGFRPERGKPSDTVEVRFLKWLNRLISHQMINLLRNNYSKWQRPCIKCAFNTGDGSCSKTASRRQSEECKFFKDWKRRKEAQFNIKQTLSMEYHSQEVENYQSDFFDVAEAKKVVDIRMKERLTKFEWKVYRMLYIEHRTEAEVGLKLKLKKVGKMFHGYQRVLSLKHRFKDMIREISEQEGWSQ